MRKPAYEPVDGFRPGAPRRLAGPCQKTAAGPVGNSGRTGKAIGRGRFAGLEQAAPMPPHRYLSFQGAGGLINGFAFCEAEGTPLTAHLVLSWRTCRRFSEKNWSRYQGAILEKLNKWFARKTGRADLRFIWVRERANGRGVHTHILLNCPPRLIKPLRIYLERLAGAESGKGPPLRKGEHPFRLEPCGNSPAARWGLLRYFLKGMCPDECAYCPFPLERVRIAETLGIECEETGRIAIKRAGSSQNIAQSARKKSGWQELKTLKPSATMGISVSAKSEKELGKSSAF